MIKWFLFMFFFFFFFFLIKFNDSSSTISTTVASLLVQSPSFSLALILSFSIVVSSVRVSISFVVSSFRRRSRSRSFTRAFRRTILIPQYFVSEIRKKLQNQSPFSGVQFLHIRNIPLHQPSYPCVLSKEYFSEQLHNPNRNEEHDIEKIRG